MTGNEILQADMLDILFDNRNKDYGAYRLRKFYANRLLLSLGIALSTVLLLFFLFNAGNSNSGIAKAKDQVIMTSVVIPTEKKKIEIIQPPKKIEAPAPAASQRKFVSRVDIVDDHKVIDKKLLPNQDFNDFIPSDQDVDGVPGGIKVPMKINTSGSGGGLPSQASNNEAPLINREPEFPGGVQAWLRFLNRNLRAPEDLEPGEKKTVLISFEVAIDGSVTGFQVVQSGGKFYDDEVIRVLKKMPKWKPALQKSQPVAVPFTQPVTFMGVEE